MLTRKTTTESSAPNSRWNQAHQLQRSTQVRGCWTNCRLHVYVLGLGFANIGLYPISEVLPRGSFEFDRSRFSNFRGCKLCRRVEDTWSPLALCKPRNQRRLIREQWAFSSGIPTRAQRTRARVLKLKQSTLKAQMRTLPHVRFVVQTSVASIRLRHSEVCRCAWLKVVCRV